MIFAKIKLLQKQTLANAFLAMDKDCSGEIDKDEWIEACERKLFKKKIYIYILIYIYLYVCLNYNVTDDFAFFFFNCV